MFSFFRRHVISYKLCYSIQTTKTVLGRFLVSKVYSKYTFFYYNIIVTLMGHTTMNSISVCTPAMPVTSYVLQLGAIASGHTQNLIFRCKVNNTLALDNYLITNAAAY